MKSINKAFTLVELIVVVIIIAILSTIGFVSYSGYITSVRDTNRITQLSSIYNGLELYKVKRYLPIPEDKIDIEANGNIIAYQGYLGKSNLEIIEYSKEGKDPKDDTYFSYYLTQDKKYFQLMTFLEDEESITISTSFKSFIPQTYATIDYSNRYPYVFGNKLGILTSEDNIPIQEIPSIQTETKLDIITSTGTYHAHFLPSEYASGSGIITYKLEEVAELGGKFCGATETKEIYCSGYIAGGETGGGEEITLAADLYNFSDDGLKEIFADGNPYTEHWDSNNCNTGTLSIDTTTFLGGTQTIGVTTLSANTIYKIPNGTYSVTGETTSDGQIRFGGDCIALVGESRDGVIFQNATTSGGGEYSKGLFNIVQRKNIIFTHLTIDGLDASSHYYGYNI